MFVLLGKRKEKHHVCVCVSTYFGSGTPELGGEGRLGSGISDDEEVESENQTLITKRRHGRDHRQSP